jgi:hypothetical protein
VLKRWWVAFKILLWNKVSRTARGKDYKSLQEPAFLCDTAEVTAALLWDMVIGTSVHYQYTVYQVWFKS